MFAYNINSIEALGFILLYRKEKVKKKIKKNVSLITV